MPRWAPGYQASGGFTSDATLYDSSTGTGHSITAASVAEQTLLLDLGAIPAAPVKRIATTLRHNETLSTPLVEYASSLAGPWTAPPGAAGAVSAHACTLSNAAWNFTLTTATTARYWRTSTRNTDNNSCGTSVVGCQEIEAQDSSFVHISENAGPASFTVTPASRSAHVNTLTGAFTITLDVAAVGGGEAFTIIDNDSGILYPPSLTIPSGLTTGTFAYQNPKPGSYILTVTDVTSGMGSVQVQVFVEGFPDWQLRLYDNTGKRMKFPPDSVIDCEFEVLERGGYGRGSFRTLTAWEDFIPAGTERADIYYRGTLAYRGNLRVPQRTGDDNLETCSPVLYGQMEKLNLWMCDRRYVYPAPVDLSTIFNDIVSNYVNLSGRLPIGPLVTDVQTIGAQIQYFDARGKSVAQAFNALCDAAPFQAIWGFDNDGALPVPADRLYLRPRSSAIAYRVSIGGEVARWEYPSDLTSIVNRVRVTGGKVSQPNLVTNGSFEDPLPASETVGNLLGDYSFELNTSWTYSGGASRLTSGANGGPHTGSYWAELDTNNEEINQVVNIDYRVLYTLSCWARRENAGILRDLYMMVEGRNAAHAVVTTISQVVDPAGTTYQRFTLACDFSAFSTVVEARVRLHASPTAGGSASNDGLDLDDVGFYETNGVANSGWTYALGGVAKRAQLNWQSFMGLGTFDRAYAVLAQASGIAGAGDFMDIRTDQAHRIPVVAQRYYTMLGWFKATNAIDTVSVQINAAEYRSDHTLIGTTLGRTIVVTPGAPQWLMVYWSWTTNASTAELEIILRLVTNNTAVYLDGVMLVEGDMPPDPWRQGAFWEADTYSRLVDVTHAPLLDTVATGGTVISSAAANSITTYGLQEGIESNAAVIDELSLDVWAVGYFNAHALPKQQGVLTLLDPKALVTPSGTVRLINIAQPPDALFPSRMHTTIGSDGIVKQEIDVGNERPDMADFLTLTAQRARARFPYPE